ncbi:S-adenosyl-L-methionine-dependent methyltransferase [Mariannaea sp. PMI_226]|nr:S-adenosyl-L-methionine-dependent methyltransferase [Mariannaea sp. PMI_226]
MFSRNRTFDEVIDLTGDLGPLGHRLARQTHFNLETFRTSGNIVVKAGNFLQIQELNIGEYSAEFLLVRQISRCKSSGKVTIRGVPFARTSMMLGKLPRKSNEKLEVGFISHGSKKKKAEEALIRIHADAVKDPRYHVVESSLGNRWRGISVKGGSWIPDSRHSRRNIIDLDGNRDQDESKRMPGQKYTVFDACSGAGGVSRGALMAGFKIQYAVDKAPDVWQTYGMNFPDTKLYKMSLNSFLSTTINQRMQVDVLHFSPPCQFFSPAHTTASVHDDENIFALFSCNQLLKKLRPRIVTVEQTFGLTHERHLEWFFPFLGDFTQHGYSVRWKIVRLCTWGAAQDRKRLVIIAAAPGERLPPFPSATHSEDGRGGLLPYNTIVKALSGRTRPDDDLHDVNNTRHFNPPRRPYDANRLAGTITTGGGDIYFPDGTRELTLREWANLQGFPQSHMFCGTKTSIKRQIGNAFPPSTVRVLYSHIEEWLLSEDQMQRFDNSILVDDDSDTCTLISETEVGNRSPNMGDVIEMDDVMEISEGQARCPILLDDDDCMVIDLN